MPHNVVSPYGFIIPDFKNVIGSSAVILMRRWCGDSSAADV